jgi:hypothetical protein
MFLRLTQTFLAIRDGSDLSGKPNFTKHHNISRDWATTQTGKHGQDDRQISPRLGDTYAAHNV